jgi:YtkA-like
MTRSGLLAVGFVLFSCGGADAGSSVDFPEQPYASFGAEGGALELEVRTAPSQPPERGEVVASLTVRDTASRAPVEGLSIDVVPWMIAHGHGSNVTPTVTPLGRGVYRIENLQLVMAGAWELRMDLHGQGTEVRAKTTLDVR